MWSIFAISLLSWLIGMKIDFFNWTTLTHSGSLALGGLIAYYEYTNPTLIKTISQWLKKHFYLVILFIAIAIFLPRSLGYIQKFSSHLFSIAGFSSILLIILYYEISFLKTNWLIFIGKISYGIYVYHALLRPFFKQNIYLPLQEMFPNENGLLVILMYTSISIIFSILIAWISWELYEKQVLKFKKYFSYTASSKNKGL
jgi:peptidoglycan/LPS O-acetylase OafA/YrhL